MIEITSDGGRIYGLEWHNTIPGIDLSTNSFRSPCGNIHLARSMPGRGTAHYWGWVRFKTPVLMDVSDAMWVTWDDTPAVEVKNHASLKIRYGVITEK